MEIANALVKGYSAIRVITPFFCIEGNYPIVRVIRIYKSGGPEVAFPSYKGSEGSVWQPQTLLSDED